MRIVVQQLNYHLISICKDERLRDTKKETYRFKQSSDKTTLINAHVYKIIKQGKTTFSNYPKINAPETLGAIHK